MLLSVQTASVVDDLGEKEGYAAIAEAGFQAIDWNLDHAWSAKGAIERTNGVVTRCIFDEPMDKILDFYRSELNTIRENGLIIGQAHAPFPSYRFEDPASLDYTIKVDKKVIEFCDIVGCPQVVIHGITRRYRDTRVTAEEVDALNDKLYESLIPTLQKAKRVTVCMENLGASSVPPKRVCGHCSDERAAAAYLDKMNEKAGKTCFGLCLDTGHLFLLHKDFGRYIHTLGSRITALHVHDNNAYSDSHLAPYSGDLPWEEFLAAIRDIDYKGTLNFETFNATSLTRIPRELVEEFLRHIAVIGNYFIAQIEEDGASRK